MTSSIVKLLPGVLGVLFITLAADALIPILAVSYLLLLPISPNSYVKMICELQDKLLYNFTFLTEVALGLEFRLTGTPLIAEGTIGLSNHQNVDYLMMYAWATRCNLLGRLRVVVKRAVVIVPVWGTMMFFALWPIVSRNFKQDEKRLRHLFKMYNNADLDAVLWSFPEGTRMTPHKLESSQKYQAEKGLRVTKHVMMPRHRGFITALNTLGEHAKSVNEVTIMYEGWDNQIPGIGEFFSADYSKPHTMHMHINRVPIEEIPKDDEGRQQWLRASFERKEDLIEHYHKNGNKFPGKEVAPRVLSKPYYTAIAVLWLGIIIVSHYVYYRIAMALISYIFY